MEDEVILVDNKDTTTVQSWVDSGLNWADKGVDILGKIKGWGGSSDTTGVDVGVSVGSKSDKGDTLLGMNKTLAIVLIAIVSLTALGLVVKYSR